MFQLPGSGLPGSGRVRVLAAAMMGGRNRGWGALVATALLTGVLAAPVGAARAAEAAALPASAARAATMTDLGTLPGGTNSSAFAINAAGQVTGNAETAGGDRHAFRWTASGGMQDLGTLGGTNSYASAINAPGQVTGFADTAGGALHAFLWTP